MSFRDLGIEPTTFCAANAMLYHWATGTLEWGLWSEQGMCVPLWRCLKCTWWRERNFFHSLQLACSRDNAARCPLANLLTHTVQRCHGNIPAKDNEEIRSLPLPSAFQWAHTHALLTPKSPLQGDRDDHFHLELACELFDMRTVTPLTNRQCKKKKNIHTK